MADEQPTPLSNPIDPPARETAADRSEQIAEIADAVAELRAAQVARQVAGEETRRGLRPLETVMVVLLAISLIIHALTISRLLNVRNTLRSEVDQLASSVQTAKSRQVSYDMPINQELPVNIDVPIQRSLEIPIDTEVRINQTINVPVDTALGTFNLPIPLDVTIPISTTVPITFDQTINISTTVPINFDVPINVDLSRDPVAGYLDRLHKALLELRDKL